MSACSRDLASAKLVMQNADGSETAVDVPVLHGTCGPSALDVRGLYQKMGVFLHDPGFTSTSACESSITFIDGATSTLLHGGYAIEDLAREACFLEVCFLLLKGELPTESELQQFQYEIALNAAPYSTVAFLESFSQDAHPMAMMVGVLGALSACAPDANNSESLATGRREQIATSLVAQIPGIAAMAYKRSIGEPIVHAEPVPGMSFSANFLRMMFDNAKPTAQQQVYVPSPTMVAAMDTIFLLHADHEQNASTCTVRAAGSSGANPYAVVAAGLATLWGPSHGGANEAVIKMIEEISVPANIPTFLAKAKDPKDSFRLMGFGHRVYKSFDPRAIEMRSVCLKVIAEIHARAGPANELGATAARLDSFLTIAMELESAALKDQYFIDRGLFPNVDFYSGITLTAIGIPPCMFTVIFAIGRMPGWAAQWKESLRDKSRKICRPRQVYKGRALRPYVPIDARAAPTDEVHASYPCRL